MTEMTIGTRRLQKVRGAYILNIPIYAVRTLGLLTGDKMSVVLIDNGTLKIEKEEHGALPDMNLAGSNQAATSNTPNGGAASA